MHRWSLTVLLSLAALAAGILAPNSAARKRTTTPPAPLATADGPLEVALAFDTNAVTDSGTSERFLVVTIQAPAAAASSRHPVDLALVMDVSGSMSADGKLDQSRRAAHALVDAMGPEDQLALVTFEDQGRLLLPLGADASRAHALIDTIEPGGGTNISEGLRLGLEAMSDRDAVRKLVLVTDGQANAGITDPGRLAAMAGRDGVTVAALGVGLGYNEVLLSRMADAGGGSYAYVYEGMDLGGLFERELASAATLVARDNHLTLTFGEGATPVDVLAWEGTVSGQTVQLPVGDLAAGQSRRVVVRVSVDGATVDAEHIVSAALTGTAVSDGAGFAEAETLAMNVVADEAATTAWVERDAQKATAQAVAASAAEDAADDYRRGDTHSARSKLSAAFRQVTARQDAYAIPELKNETDQLHSLGYMDAGVASKAASEYSRSSGRGE